METIDDAHARFVQESYRFVLAQNFFLVAAVAGHKGDAKIAERHKKFDEAVSPEYEDGYAYLSAQLFVTYVSSFEIFLQQIVTAVVTKNPEKLGSHQFRLSDILTTGSTDELVAKAIDECLNKLMYKRPMEYLDDLCHLLSIDRKQIEDLWPTYVEAKARRDLGVHAAWKCNATYLRKVSEAGLSSKLQIGESAVPEDEDYIVPLGEVLEDLAERIVKLVEEKHGD